MADGIIRHPAVGDVEALADIYVECFPDRVKKVFGHTERRVFIHDYLQFYLSWDPDHNWVYLADEKVLGFVIAPCQYAPARALLANGQVVRCLWHLLTGRYGLPFHMARLFLLSGFAFTPEAPIRRLRGKPYVHLLAVKKCGQGKGIGSKLMEWTLEQYERRSVDFCWLVVEGDNVRGIQFYARFGFRVHVKLSSGDLVMTWRGTKG